MDSYKIYKLTRTAVETLKNEKDINRAIGILDEVLRLSGEVDFDNVVDEYLLNCNFNCDVKIIEEGRKATLTCGDIYIVLETDGRYELYVKAYFNNPALYHNTIEIYNKHYQYYIADVYDDIKKNILSKQDIFKEICNRLSPHVLNYELESVRLSDDCIMIKYRGQS